MKSYSSREVIKALKADGWYEVNVVGSHHQYKHIAPAPPGKTRLGGYFHEKGRTLFLSCCLHL